jgi:hypothetical protein
MQSACSAENRRRCRFDRLLADGLAPSRAPLSRRVGAADHLAVQPRTPAPPISESTRVRPPARRSTPQGTIRQRHRHAREYMSRQSFTSVYRLSLYSVCASPGRFILATACAFSRFTAFQSQTEYAVNSLGFWPAPTQRLAELRRRLAWRAHCHRIPAPLPRGQGGHVPQRRPRNRGPAERRRLHAPEHPDPPPQPPSGLRPRRQSGPVRLTGGDGTAGNPLRCRGSPGDRDTCCRSHPRMPGNPRAPGDDYRWARRPRRDNHPDPRRREIRQRRPPRPRITRPVPRERRQSHNVNMTAAPNAQLPDRPCPSTAQLHAKPQVALLIYIRSLHTRPSASTAGSPGTSSATSSATARRWPRASAP